MSKRVHGNKEAKKPKRAKGVTVPPGVGPTVPAPAGWPKPHPGKR